MIKIKQGMSGATIQWTKMAVPLVQWNVQKNSCLF
jgi:hypothetical protein